MSTAPHTLTLRINRRSTFDPTHYVFPGWGYALVNGYDGDRTEYQQAENTMRSKIRTGCANQTLTPDDLRESLATLKSLFETQLTYAREAARISGSEDRTQAVVEAFNNSYAALSQLYDTVFEVFARPIPGSFDVEDTLQEQQQTHLNTMRNSYGRLKDEVDRFRYTVSRYHQNGQVLLVDAFGG